MLATITNFSRTRRIAAVAVVLAVAATLVWATASPAGSYQAPLQMQQVTKVVRMAPGAESVRGVARCPEGSVATGGGVRVGADEPVMIEFDTPARDGRGWEARGGSIDEDEPGPHTFTVTAMCARGSQAGDVAAVSNGR